MLIIEYGKLLNRILLEQDVEIANNFIGSCYSMSYSALTESISFRKINAKEVKITEILLFLCHTKKHLASQTSILVRH
jgi:hypothetical protein